MIVFSQVTKQFGDNPPSVEEVSFNVDDGEFLFLTGHSGSGKTTLLKLLTKEYLLSSGEIEFDGEELSKLKSGKVHHHRRKIGVVYQDYRLLPELNVWENIALSLEIIGKPQAEIEERVTDLLELVQLTDKAYFFPAELSGGESQRVGIARALATAPNVLLADEPTGNLDPENTLMIARLFDKIHQLGTTVLFATHDIEVLEHLGHRRLKLEKGKIIEDTPAKEGKKKVKVEKTPDKELPKTEEKTEKVTKPEKEKIEKTESKEPAKSVEKEAVKEKKNKLRLPSFKFPTFKKARPVIKHKDQDEEEEAVEDPTPPAPPAPPTPQPPAPSPDTDINVNIEEL
jgi:cell division transport system ATP-binding protein